MRISIQTSPHSIRFFLKIVTMKHSIASRQPVPASQHTPLCSIHFLPEIICVSIHIRIPAVHHPAICIKSEPVKRTLPLCRIGIWIVDSRPLRSIASTARFKLPASICILPPVSSYYIFRYGCRIRILPGACLSFCQFPIPAPVKSLNPDAGPVAFAALLPAAAPFPEEEPPPKPPPE